MKIISRGGWGFSGWRSTPRSRPVKGWTHFVVHYEGANPCGHQVGASVPRGIHNFHKNGRRWAGIGYNFVVDQKGNVFEGRGWTLQGAHKPSGPGSNPVGIGVQVHIGGNEQPSKAALAAVRDLYDEACRRSGRTLVKSYHSDGYSTSCPGGPLKAWVRAGMPRPNAPAPAQSDKTVLAAQAAPAAAGVPAPLVVDGIAGDKTWRALCWYLKVEPQVDARGRAYRSRMLNRHICSWLGRERRPFLEADDVLAVQARVGATRTGKWTTNTNVGLQRFLNRRIADARKGK